MLAIADAFSAMTQDRPYLKARSLAQALEEIRGQAGSQFDPELAEQFLKFAATGELDNVAPVPVPGVLRGVT